MGANEWQEQARKLAAEGESWNGIARRLHVARVAVQRYLKLSGVKKAPSTESRALLKIRHEKLTGHLDAALEAAYSLRTVAEEKMDTRLLLAANKQIGKILSLQAQTMPRLPMGVDVPTVPRYTGPWQMLPPLVDDFPSCLRGLHARFFGGIEKELPPGAPTIRWKIKFQDEAPTNEIDLPLAKSGTDLGPDELAQQSSPGEIAVELK